MNNEEKVNLYYIRHYFYNLQDELIQSDYEGINRGDENVNNFVSLIKLYISKGENILEAINNDDKKVSDEDFFKRIEELFKVDLNDEQFLKMISEINKKIMLVILKCLQI